MKLLAAILLLELATDKDKAEIDFNDLVEINVGPPDIQLILGGTFLRQFIFQFDYPRQRMRAITRDSLDLKEYRNV